MAGKLVMCLLLCYLFLASHDQSQDKAEALSARFRV